MQSSIHFTIRH